jgi:Holliday junction DNA helicase RuvA
LLTTVTGIGPKLALNVLSSMPITDLLCAIRTEDVEKLATIPGIGKKSAGRIALELKDKVGKVESASGETPAPQTAETGGFFDDALSALVNLGYRPHDVKEALRRVTKTSAGPLPLTNLIREGLKELARG